ncbi:MAG TPA: hypothetical protein VFQ12_05120, partial [Thermoleophilaceae bacterium]|nr:hypothetical protein [Thermoleophilaceae bacterium]
MSAYLSALLIAAASIVVGAAVTGRAERHSWTAPSIGLAALMLLALVTIRLPGHGATAAAATGIAVVASAVALARRRVSPESALVGVLALILVGAFCSLPFIANARIGILGVGVLDDLSFHMGQADAMRTLGAGANVTSEGYPSGPHALLAALSDGTTIGISPGFTGLLLATPVLTALTALAALEGARWELRVLGAALAGTAYLPASYLAEGAFKEPLLALFLLGFVLTLREAHQARRLERAQILALLLVAAAGVSAFGVTALAWPAMALLWLGLLELGYGRREQLLHWRPRPAFGVVGLFALSAAAAALAAGAAEFFDSGPGRYLTDSGVGGNYVGQLSPLEALGAWPEADFRISPAVDPLLALGTLLALAVVVHGLVWCWTHREWALLGGALGAASIYLVARPVTLAYFSGKALVVAAPLLALIAAKALLALIAQARGRPITGRIALAALIAYAGIAGYSSALALRAAQVRPPDRGPDLERFRSIVADQPTLYLGRDNYVAWDLREAQLSGYQRFASASVTPLEARAEKAAEDADPPAVDVDSIDYRSLDRFRYLVTPRTRYASLPPPNFRLIRRTRWHLLWERRGATRQRWILDEGEAPGAVFDCRTASTRRLRRLPGRAMVRPRPVLGRVEAWRTPDGASTGAPGEAASGDSLVQRLHLPRGEWELSFRYFSSVPLRVRAGSLAQTIPAYLGDRSSFVSIGTVRTDGQPLTVKLEVPERRRIALTRSTMLGSLAATRLDRAPRLVPLGSACGRYVDWIDPGVLR